MMWRSLSPSRTRAREQARTLPRSTSATPVRRVKRPVMELKQFSKVRLKAGETQHVVLQPEQARLQLLRRGRKELAHRSRRICHLCRRLIRVSPPQAGVLDVERPPTSHRFICIHCFTDSCELQRRYSRDPERPRQWLLRPAGIGKRTITRFEQSCRQPTANRRVTAEVGFLALSVRTALRILHAARW